MPPRVAEEQQPECEARAHREEDAHVERHRQQHERVVEDNDNKAERAAPDVCGRLSLAEGEQALVRHGARVLADHLRDAAARLGRGMRRE